MKKITDYKDVSPLLLRYFKRGVVTNNFLSADDYKCEIAEERLFYSAGEDYLNVYVKRDGFYILYFHALSEEAVFPEVSGRLICDVAADAAVIMKNNGFLKMLDRVQLECLTGGKASSCVVKAQKQDAEKIFLLMNNSFDKFSGYVPNFSQLAKECDEGMIYKAELCGELAGVLRTGKKGKTAQIKHLCVAEDFRGRGVGKALCSALLGENEKCTVWTGSENTAALNLYKSLGFLKSGLTSTVYTKG